MVYRYKIIFRVIIFCFIISISKLSNKIDNYIHAYPLIVIESIIFKFTKLNWQYGFFTSDYNTYYYNDVSIKLLNNQNTIDLTPKGDFSSFGYNINSTRLNTVLQKIVRDSLLLEAGSRGIALYYFKRNTKYNNMYFMVNSYSCRAIKNANHFKYEVEKKVYFNTRLSY
jgi:hypothetical protein